MDDRRSKPRLSMSLDAVWNGSGGNYTARVSNLSEGGCYLDTVGETRVGEIVCFRILLPDDNWLYLEGEVRHHHPGVGFGVQFVDLNSEQEALVKWLLENATEVQRTTGPLSADIIQD